MNNMETKNDRKGADFSQVASDNEIKKKWENDLNNASENP